MPPKRFLFHHERRRSNPVHILLLMFFLICGLLVNQALVRRDITPLFEPTPTATRIANSFILEARAHFDAGNLEAAIQAFEQALQVDPNNGELYAEQARVLTYSSEMVTTESEREDRLKQAESVARKGVALSPDDSTVHAVLAFTLDWYATYMRDTLLLEKEGKEKLLDADQEIAKATALDQTNLTAQIYYSEIMINSGRYVQADESLQALLARAPDSWEAHRVNGLYLETQAEYVQSIDEFKTASRLAPKMTFLLIKLGQASRQYAMRLKAGAEQDGYFQNALDYFDAAANLNEQLGIQDPYPYLGIGYTYAQLGEFFIASRNMSHALSFNPKSPKVYGDLGMVARQGKNYELAVNALKCAVEGCDEATSCRVRECDEETDEPIVIQGMSLNMVTVSYYFTYAALLSGMYIPNDPKRVDYCDTALKVIGEVRAVPQFNNEPVYDNIMKESENICASYGITTPRH